MYIFLDINYIRIVWRHIFQWHYLESLNNVFEKCVFLLCNLQFRWSFVDWFFVFAGICLGVTLIVWADKWATVETITAPSLSTRVLVVETKYVHHVHASPLMVPFALLYSADEGEEREPKGIFQYSYTFTSSSIAVVARRIDALHLRGKSSLSVGMPATCGYVSARFHFIRMIPVGIGRVKGLGKYVCLCDETFTILCINKTSPDPVFSQNRSGEYKPPWSAYESKKYEPLITLGYVINHTVIASSYEWSSEHLKVPFNSSTTTYNSYLPYRTSKKNVTTGSKVRFFQNDVTERFLQFSCGCKRGRLTLSNLEKS